MAQFSDDQAKGLGTVGEEAAEKKLEGLLEPVVSS